MKKVLLLLCVSGLMSACTGVSYGHKTFNVSPEQEAQMARDSARVKADERAERKERRAERREEMMDTADAIRRSKGPNERTYNFNYNW